MGPCCLLDQIHGGTSEHDIMNIVAAAQDLAVKNQEKCEKFAKDYGCTEVGRIKFTYRDKSSLLDIKTHNKRKHIWHGWLMLVPYQFLLNHW